MRTERALTDGVATGRELGAQLYASRAGETVLHLAVGSARPGVQMTPEHLNLWISMSKPVMGVAYGQLLERGLVTLEERVARYLPEFAQGGKEAVTLKHLLTHTAGFRSAHREWIGPPFAEVVARICAAPQEPGWVVGETSGYNVAAAWYVLAAVLERVDGRAFARYCREAIFEPLGMDDCHIGMSPERFDAYGDRVAVMHTLRDGRFVGDPAWGTRAGVAIERPGGNGYGPMRQLARLFEMLLGGGTRAGTTLLRPETAALITTRHTEGLRDRTFGATYDRGLGVVLESSHHGDGFCWYGPHASRETFGHQGFFSGCALADPAHELVVCVSWNGVRAFDPVHDSRVNETLDALYRDLGLV